ncbi:hypothetical protein L2E82_25211 [Cichorium intybus]|uniref:Uncharacterized protein n=1 Tax=Cichorium intybus TaxID=13427 RepID=A0ACB9E2V1_CICIN|nr:hypothetical protein L2E82_25211 [Cichorium intybus]
MQFRRAQRPEANPFTIFTGMNRICLLRIAREFIDNDNDFASMESAKHWELLGEELGTGTRRSDNHLNGGINCTSSIVPPYSIAN